MFGTERASLSLRDSSMRRLALSVAALAFAGTAFSQVVTAPVAPRVAEGFAPHRATYDLTLKRAKWSAEIAGVSGRLVSEFDDVCEGFTYNQRLVTSMKAADGTNTEGNYWISTYEAADGSSFRFSITNTVNGAQTDKAQGSASRQSDGATEVAFTGPDGKKIVLPAATVFPTEFMGRAVVAAKSGKKAYSAHMFEGDGEGKVYDAYMAIGSERQATETQLALPGGDALKDLRAWPVTVSYYVVGEKNDLPDYETSFLLFENGITADITLDYGDFALNATLRRIDGAKKPGC